MQDEALLAVTEKLAIGKSTDLKNDAKFKALVEYLDHLINTDFNKLIGILYRIDVSEERLRKALASEDKKVSSGYTVAKLLIERETEKIIFRKKYSSRSS